MEFRTDCAAGEIGVWVCGEVGDSDLREHAVNVIRHTIKIAANRMRFLDVRELTGKVNAHPGSEGLTRALGNRNLKDCGYRRRVSEGRSKTVSNFGRTSIRALLIRSTRRNKAIEKR